MSRTKISIPLDLPDVRVLGTRPEGPEWLIIEVESTLTGTNCQRCGRHIEHFHGHDRPIQLRHLPAFGREIKIEIRPKRYRCPDCEGGPTSTQRCEWYDPNRPHTRAYEKWVMGLLIHSTVADVARLTALGVKAIEGIFRRHVDAEVNWAALSDLETLGIDEIALYKGRGAYKAVILGRDSQRRNHILAVLTDREKATVSAFLRQIPDRLSSTIQRVCIDLWSGYAAAVREVLPEGVAVVADRFHVAKLYRGAVDEVRKCELRRLQAERAEQDTAPCKGAMWPLRHRWSRLSTRQRVQVSQVLDLSPTLSRAYQLRETLTAIFDTTTDRDTAAARLDAWANEVKRLEVSCFDTFLATLQTWREAILNYFDGRHNSGFVEGMNNKLKLLKRRCFGLDNPVELFRRLRLDVEQETCWSS